MKSVLVGLLLIGSISAQAEAPKYSTKSADVVGNYSKVNGNCADSRTKRPCIAATVYKDVNGNLLLNLESYERGLIPLAESNGRLVFKWENPKDDDCDNPGCGNLLSLSGVIYPKKIGKEYVPMIKVYVKLDYPFPDEEGAPEGEVTETESYTKRD